jgi:hypothetical protein
MRLVQRIKTPIVLARAFLHETLKRRQLFLHGSALLSAASYPDQVRASKRKMPAGCGQQVEWEFVMSSKVENRIMAFTMHSFLGSNRKSASGESFAFLVAVVEVSGVHQK